MMATWPWRMASVTLRTQAFSPSWSCVMPSTGPELFFAASSPSLGASPSAAGGSGAFAAAGAAAAAASARTSTTQRAEG